MQNNHGGPRSGAGLKKAPMSMAKVQSCAGAIDMKGIIILIKL